MKYKIKFSLTLLEIEHLTKLINLPNKFSYELGQISYSEDYIEFLSNQEDFICVFFYKDDDDDDEDVVDDDYDIKNINAFVLGNTNMLYVQNSKTKYNKLLNNLSDDFFISEKFDYTRCLFIDFFYIDNEYLSLKDITCNLKFNFENCIYKLNKNIESSFLKRYYYYRPINLDLLKNLNILNDVIVTNTFTKVYNTFTYPISFNKNKVIKLNEKLSNENLEILIYKLLEYNFVNFEILCDINENFIKNILNSDLFYKFFIYDKTTNDLTDFVCFKKFQFVDDKNKCDNAHFYMGFYEYNNLQYKYDINEYICMYASKHKLFDMMTITDNINNKKQKINTKFLKSIKKEYYYDTNLDLFELNYEHINVSI